MMSSWMRAQTCSSSTEQAARTVASACGRRRRPGAPVAPVHEGRPQALAAREGEAGQGVGDRAGVLTEEVEGRQLRSSSGQGPVDPGAQVLGVQGDAGTGWAASVTWLGLPLGVVTVVMHASSM